MAKTTSYRIVVTGENYNDLADDLKARCPIPVEQVSVYTNVKGSLVMGVPCPDNDAAAIRFRIPSDDAAAMEVAREIAAGRPFLLTTGYGVHRRDVGSQG